MSWNGIVPCLLCRNKIHCEGFKYLETKGLSEGDRGGVFACFVSDGSDESTGLWNTIFDIMLATKRPIDPKKTCVGDAIDCFKARIS